MIARAKVNGDNVYVINEEESTLDTVNVTEEEEELDKVELGKLGEFRKNQLLRILKKHAALFKSVTKGGNANIPVRHKIELLDKSRVGQKLTYNRRSLVELEEQRKYVRDLLERDLIEPGDGEFVAPMLMVRKKDGTKRVVIDY